MQLTSAACNHCGASLQIADSARFVTCRYCNAQLEIKRTDSSVSTEVLHQINQNTASMAADLQAIRHSAELERLDREWTARYRGKDGSHNPPTAAAGYFIMCVVGGIGLLWTIGSIGVGLLIAGAIYAADAPWFCAAFPCIFPLFGIFFIVLAITLGIKTLNAAAKYPDELRQYQLRREQLLTQIAKERPTP
ncbi:MAG: hypothetical protein FWD53_04380 [Phycisphaerales bacterium]|nr:hypothetical protein [Phycisphaerales bacterium]